jgi:hypothetical protein
LTAAQGSFVARLRAARERAGVSLDTIAESTKIKRSFLIGLEKGDLSHWPCGIFRRSFFREYLGAIGISAESLVDDFVRLFPEQGGTLPADTGTEEAGELRLTLADAPETAVSRVARHLPAAIVDLGFVALVAGVAAFLFELQFSAAAAFVALAYYSAGTLYAGRTPGALGVSGARRTFKGGAPIRSSAVRELHIVSRQSELPRKWQAGEGPTEETLPSRPRLGSRRRLRPPSRVAR